MRNPIACLILIPAIACVGCGDKRENMGVAVDRHHHASGDEQGGPGVQTKVAKKNEAYYTMVEGDTLYSVAKAYNIELSALISRNGITSPNPKAGTQLIVPARSTGGGGAKTK